MAEIEPVAVWDVRDPAWHREREAKTQWLRDQGLPTGQMYRAEFLPGDAPRARIFCYHLNDEDRRHWNQEHVRGPHDHSNCDAAREAPRIVPLGDLPPRELLEAR